MRKPMRLELQTFGRIAAMALLLTWSGGVLAAPMISHIEENSDEGLAGLAMGGQLIPPNANGDLIIPFGGGKDGSYAHFDSAADKKNNIVGDSFDLKDNGNNTTTLSKFFSDVGDTGGDAGVENVIVRDPAGKKIVAVIRIDSPVEKAVEPASMAVLGTALMALGFFNRHRRLRTNPSCRGPSHLPCCY